MALSTLAGTVARLAQQTVIRTRPGVVTVDGYGVATRAAGAVVTGIRGVVTRPARIADLMHLPEGDRSKKTCSVVLSTDLALRDVLTTEDGEQYEIQGVSPHPYVGFWAGVGVKLTDQ
jgi:hypothetical protein